MATSFPTGLDALTNPTSANGLNSPDHAGQHSDANDAIEALQAKVGVNSSAVTTSLDYKFSNLGVWTSYTPTFSSGVTAGNGTWIAAYSVIGKILFFQGTFTFGSTTSVSAGAILNLPSSYTLSANGDFLGSFRMGLGATGYYGGVRESTSTTLSLFAYNSSTTYLSGTGISSTIPATWATGDTMQISYVAQLA